MNLLALRGVSPEKYSLALMDALFTDEELSVSCFASTKRSTKTPLEVERVELLKGNNNYTCRQMHGIVGRT